MGVCASANNNTFPQTKAIIRASDYKINTTSNNNRSNLNSHSPDKLPAQHLLQQPGTMPITKSPTTVGGSKATLIPAELIAPQPPDEELGPLFESFMVRKIGD